MSSLEQELVAAIRNIPDYPKPGIMFRDITTLLGNPRAFRRAVDELVHPYAGIGIAKRELTGVELLAIKSPDDLDRARQLIENHGQYAQGEHVPDFRIVVTPAKGVFTRADGLDEGRDVARGATLGTIATNREQHEILAQQAGVLTEWLRASGDIVPAGLPVARIHSGADL